MAIAPYNIPSPITNQLLTPTSYFLPPTSYLLPIYAIVCTNIFSLR